MRHTVRRAPQGVEQAGARPRPVRRAERATRHGAASGATPPRLGLMTTRISHKVPEPDADSASRRVTRRTQPDIDAQ
ncbi:hypothetical protein FH965_17555 [Streptomyces spectabilis]|uniref:Uncharacterized protein n=1 Tax=Streptomyces spectabilis TaxID=68270 RepID=A0A516R927_STRST|nr:hypothetical protein FH965_17555 [Streptomyces spectabilis]